MMGQYLEYAILMNCLNKFPHWYEVKGLTNGLDMTKGTYHPTLDVLSQSIEQAGNPHPIMTYEQFKEQRNGNN